MPEALVYSSRDLSDIPKLQAGRGRRGGLAVVAVTHVLGKL